MLMNYTDAAMLFLLHCVVNYFAGIILLDPHSPDKKSFKKNLYRILNYAFRSVLGLFHFVVAYLTYHDQSTSIRAHDKYIYMHAAIVIISIGIEITLSTFVKIKRRDYPSECAIEIRDSATTTTSDKSGIINTDVFENEKTRSSLILSRKSSSSSSNSRKGGLRETLLSKDAHSEEMEMMTED
jgi:hypothetical protein